MVMLNDAENEALKRYEKLKADADVDDLLLLREAYQRELKALEEDEDATKESTIPYMLTVAAIERRLDQKGVHI